MWSPEKIDEKFLKQLRFCQLNFSNSQYLDPTHKLRNFRFKVYLVDVGLLGAMAGLSPKTVLHQNELFQEFRGALTENFVAEELTRSHFALYYWTSKGKAELDFLIQFEEIILPTEVKSGTSTKKKSLKTYENTYCPPLTIRTSPMNLKKDGTVLNCPLYLLDRLRNLLAKNL